MDHNEGKIPPKKQLKSKKITVSFTADEGYKNPTNWMRSLVMNMLHREAVLSDKEVKSIDKLSDQLWKIGHNINQIARGINIDFRIWFLKIKAGRSHTRAFKSSPEGRKRNARTGNDPRNGVQSL